ncbi:MAG TPA: trypsin-like serine protease [Candidatus Limnocylindrales bacterium]|nr:trypsin-like serine protease [Candidatus Limnocylindrales bacterium]
MSLSRKLRVLAAATATTVALTVALAAPASAIKYGDLDGNDHPFVGLMVAQDANGAPLWRCSGTLISPTVYLTAGHCTEAPAAHVEIWFDADVDAGRPGNGYPFTGQVGGTPYTHPDYDPNAFFVRDVGVVVLDERMEMHHYPSLPALNQLDAMKTMRGKQDVTFTAVGYGLQYITPVYTEAARVRMVANPKLNQINVPGFTGDYSLLLSNNASTGGTCFGDSGGPNFIGDSLVIGGVTSFGINGNCAGTGGVFRVDRSWSLDWIETFLP